MEPDLPRLLVAQIHLEKARAHGAEDVARLLDHLGVDAAADGDRAEDPAGLVDDHPRTLLARRGAPRVHEGRDGDLARAASQAIDVLEQFAHDGIPQR
jgi:hypothetical protein